MVLIQRLIKRSNPQIVCTSTFPAPLQLTRLSPRGRHAQTQGRFLQTLNDPATVARSSPRRSDSVPSLYLTGNYDSLFGNLFRQIIPLSIWYTPTHGNILSLQAPTFYTTGVTDTRHSGCYVARCFFAICSFLTGPILLMSLRTYMEELSASFNTQDQAPDDPYAQDRRCAQCIFVDIPRKGSQVLARLLTKQDIFHLFLQLVSQDSAQELFHCTISPYLGVSRIEFQLCCLRTRFVVYYESIKREVKIRCIHECRCDDLLVKVCFVFVVLALETPGPLR
jgi:hypothetical protein